MSRAVMAVMAGLLCALAGIRHAAALKGDALRLTRWVQVLQHLTLLLRQGTMSIPEALLAAADGQQQPDRLLRQIALTLRAAPMTTLADAFAPHSTGLVEKDILFRMFTRLGHGTQESRCLASQQAADELRLLAESASAKAEKDVKLWQTLGFIGGACLTIMLL